MTFSSIHTNYGLARMTAAEMSGTPINLTHMAVGDGNGNPVTPDPAQTELVREQYRSAINRIYQLPGSTTRYAAELVVPTADGGFTLREIGVFDDTGSLFVVGNLPPAYLPTTGEGAFADAVIRVIFEVSNAGIITIMIDPSVAVASQLWVLNNVTAATIIPGGLVNQALFKASNADGDYEWRDIAELNLTVDCIEEQQTLAAAQTQVDLSTTTTNGLAVYIEGVRIPRAAGAGGWQINPADEFESIILGQSYPDGSIITLVQNDPMGVVVDPLEKSQNLADVPDKALARTNLDIFSKAESLQLAPAGMVSYFAGSSAPTGWLKANGATISRTTYAALFAAIGTTYGGGDGVNTFRLPDLRGEFLRGWDDGRGVDGGRSFGSAQSGTIQSHNHAASAGSGGDHTHTGSADLAGAHNHSATTNTAGAHIHSATTNGAGVHAHSTTTSLAGAHSHTASTDTSGAHSHSYLTPQRANDGDRGNSGASSTWSIDSSETYTTGSAGSHTHNVTVNTAGSHTHVVDVNEGGAHTHDVNVSSGGAHAHDVSVGTSGSHTHTLSINSASSHTHSVTVGSFGGAETRPRNIALLACIKY